MSIDVRAQVLQEGWKINWEVLQDHYPDLPANYAQLRQLLLDADLKKVGSQSLASLSDGNTTSIKGPLVVQVASIKDASKPSNGIGGGSKRLLCLKLVEGASSGTAVEFRGMSQLTEDAPPGTKLLLSHVKVKAGVMMLDERNCQVLGGKVESLLQGWQVQQKFGGAANREDAAASASEVAPPFTPFEASPAAPPGSGTQGMPQAGKAPDRGSKGDKGAPAGEGQARHSSAAAHTRKGFQPYAPPPSRNQSSPAAAPVPHPQHTRPGPGPPGLDTRPGPSGLDTRPGPPGLDTRPNAASSRSSCAATTTSSGITSTSGQQRGPTASQHIGSKGVGVEGSGRGDTGSCAGPAEEDTVRKASSATAGSTAGGGDVMREAAKPTAGEASKTSSASSVQAGRIAKNQEAVKAKVMGKVSEAPARWGGGRGRRGRRVFDDDDDDAGSGTMTLDEWEARKKAGPPAAAVGVPAAAAVIQMSEDERLARELQRQLDMEDYGGLHNSGASSRPGDPATDLRRTLFAFDDGPHESDSGAGRRGRGGARGRGRGRGRGRS